MRRFVIAAAVAFFVLRWIAWGVLVFATPEVADDAAVILFGPARLGNDFPKLLLPAAGFGAFQPLRFLAGEAGWAAVVVLVVWLARRR
jgi:hypothetical protein